MSVRSSLMVFWSILSLDIAPPCHLAVCRPMFTTAKWFLPLVYHVRIHYCGEGCSESMDDQSRTACGTAGCLMRNAEPMHKVNPFNIAAFGYQTVTHRPVGAILNGLGRPSAHPAVHLRAYARGRMKKAQVNAAPQARASCMRGGGAAPAPRASVQYRPYWLSTQHLIAI